MTFKFKIKAQLYEMVLRFNENMLKYVKNGNILLILRSMWKMC